MQRQKWLVIGLTGAACVLVWSCGMPPTIQAPAGEAVVAGGITDQRPYFGQLKGSGADDSTQFVLATCGCGEWKALVSEDNGGKQLEFDVRFYSAAPYVETGAVNVYGQENDNGLTGTVDQDSGAASGNIKLGTLFAQFSAQRGTNHQDQAQACILCHTGDKPISPLAASHPAYQTAPANCLDCHQVVVE